MRRLVTGALTLTLLLLAQPAAAAIRFVDDDGAATAADCDAGAPGSASTTIQAAVNAAAAGTDTIQVCPGTYAEQVTVNKELVLIGPRAGVDASDPSRTGLASTEAVVGGTATAFDVTASGVTIDGFTVQGQTTASLGAEVVISPDKSNVTIENNIVQNGIAGIAVGSDFSNIRRNVLRNLNNSGPLSGTAIYTDQFYAGGTQTAVTISGNSISNNQNVGIDLASTQELSQSDFMITENILDSNGNSILFGNLSDSTITRNVAKNSIGSSVVPSKSVSNVLIAENILQTGSARGFRFVDVGIGSQPDTDVTLRCNSISGFPSSGLTVETGVMGEGLDARFNWWGDASGPAIASNPGGAGEPIVDPDARVDYSSFLTDGTDSDAATPGFQCGPKLSVADAAVAEGNSGTSSLTFTVTLNNPSPDPVTVVYATVDGTAGGGDYQPVADILQIAPGETTKTVVVPVNGDTTVEPDETLTLKLLQPQGATLADDAAIGTIQNDDTAAPAGTPPGGNPPPAQADKKAPAVVLTAVKAKLAKALKKGLAVKLKSDEAGKATVTATVGGKVVATARVTLTSAGTKQIVLRFTKKAKAKFASARKLKLTLKARVVDAAGNAGRKSLGLTLKR